MKASSNSIDGISRYRAGIRITRLVTLGGAGFFALISADVLLMSQSHGWTGAGVFLFALCFLVSGISLIAGLWKFAPGATEIHLEPGGITFRYRNGRSARASWDGPGLPLKIYHTDGTSDAISRGMPVTATTGRLWLVDFFPEGTYVEMLRQARAAGVSVSEGPGPPLRPGWISVVLSRTKPVE
jgi:hypothetical protein